MERDKFKRAVERILNDLPARFKDKLDNVLIEVRDRPTREEMRSLELRGGTILLGLYQGVPLTERGHDFGGTMPDRITIFQKPIEAHCRTDEDVEHELRTTLIHELGHYFGMSDEDLEKLGLA